MSAATRAILFDFNGTLSHDEPIWFEVYRELYAERGRPITREEYFEQLAGLSDEEGVQTWLGRSDPELVREGIARFLLAAGDGSTVPSASRDAVAAAAAVVPVGIVTTARRAVLDMVVHAAGLTAHLSFTVTADDVTRTKPDPEGYLLCVNAGLGEGLTGRTCWSSRTRRLASPPRRPRGCAARRFSARRRAERLARRGPAHRAPRRRDDRATAR